MSAFPPLTWADFAHVEIGLFVCRTYRMSVLLPRRPECGRKSGHRLLAPDTANPRFFTRRTDFWNFPTEVQSGGPHRRNCPKSAIWRTVELGIPAAHLRRRDGR